MNQCKSPLYSKTDNVVVHLGRLPEWISEQKTVKVLIKSQECVITSLPSSITWKEYRFMNSFCGKNLLPSQNQDLVNGQRLTHSTVGNVIVNFMAKLPDDINYCCKIIGACINPFLGFDWCHHAIDLLNNEAFQCLRKVQENMDFVLSMAITEAQCSDVECKECSLLMDAPWLAASNPGGSLSIKEEETGDDNLRSSTDSQDCLLSANEGTSQLPCAFQTTEIYIPVSDCQETRPDALFHVKEEKEDPLSEGMYPAMYTPDPPEISRDVADPLATDELPLTSTPFQEERLECMAESTGAIMADFDWKLVGVKEEPSLEEKDAAKCHVKEENRDHLMEESYPMLHVRNLAGISTDVTDPLATDDMDYVQDAVVGTAQVAYSVQPAEIFIPVPDIQLPTANMLDADCDHMQAQASTSSQGEEVDAEGTGAVVVDLDSMPVLAEKESPKETDATEPTSMENGELIQKQTMAMESMTEALDLPAPKRASSCFALLEPKIGASNLRKAWKVMDKDIDVCGTHLADKITSCSIPNDGQLHSKSKHVSKIRGNRATMTVAGETSSCENPDTTKVFSVTDSEKSGPKAVMREKKEISTSVVKNPGNRAKTKDKYYHCFNCGDAFNAKHDLTEHLKIHFGSGSLDIVTNMSIGKHLALKSLFSGGESNSSYKPTSSESLNKLLCKRQGVRQKGNGLLKENFGETREKKNVREVRKSFFVDGKSCTDSSHTTKTPNYCGECEKFFSQKSDLVRHMRIHTKEKPYSCGECEKSFSHKNSLVYHIRTHTKEKPFSCNECEKSFSDRNNLVCHMRIHTKEKPYFCGECEKFFSDRSNLVCHMRIHTKEKPYSCGECEKSFSQKNSLVCHIRTHTKEKPFSCNECEKSFSDRSNLVCHMRIHTKEKPYSCGECEKSFSDRSSLVCHMRIHTKEKPYSCGECEKSFSQKNSLVCHIRTHTKEKPFSCYECEKSFSVRSNLLRHMKIHTKEIRYSCSECEKSFSGKSNLARHIRTHTKEKRYSCGECQQSYNTKRKLVLHKRVHRKEALLLH